MELRLPLEGSGCVIGFTQTIVDKVVPNLVGVDISCGMQVLKISKDFHFDLKNLDKVWRANIPMGMTHRTTKHRFCENVNLDNLITPINKEKELLALGSLGGGNHFGELDIDDEGNYYLVIHSGSRHLGVEICKYYTLFILECEYVLRFDRRVDEPKEIEVPKVVNLPKKWWQNEPSKTIIKEKIMSSEKPTVRWLLSAID